MKELMLQRVGDYLRPFDPESAERMKAFHEYQPIRAQCTGTRRPRSYRQLKGYWKACEILADNMDQFADKYAVDWAVRVELKFFGRMTVKGDNVMVETLSISYENMDHIEANNFFSRAIPLMAKWLGVAKEELLKRAEE